jgi:hypothetical protein
LWRSASHGGLWIRAAIKGVWARWARQTKNKMGWMGLEMALVLFFSPFSFLILPVDIG